MTGTLKGLLVPALLLIAAELAVRTLGTTSQSIAAPSAVVVALAQAFVDGSMLSATRDTLVAAGAGLVLGAVIGLTLGTLFGLVKSLDRLMEVTVESIRPIPSVAVIPIAMLVFGFGYSMEIAIVAFSCVWPILILTRSSIAGIEPRLLEVADALRLSPMGRIQKIVLPAALPRIMVAFRLASGIALVVAVTVEIAANPLGLGYGILLAQQTLKPEAMLAYLLWIGIVGFALNSGLAIAQRRLFGRAAQVEAHL